ncbi:hypothetical protein K470DRAFT_46407 [Piedraia hortae CBS 480.64]|uniref:Uncharacterized protein n=1 Tax=Piedraia hortae CBS 480.64 TaxID=1314780 RepID=A0A6A7C2C4_9PEZI|nr:hypothetical protein K470DRAFT_46407 [Piedraia hortae CBS 480.64]
MSSTTYPSPLQPPRSPKRGGPQIAHSGLATVDKIWLHILPLRSSSEHTTRAPTGPIPIRMPVHQKPATRHRYSQGHALQANRPPDKRAIFLQSCVSLHRRGEGTIQAYCIILRLDCLATASGAPRQSMPCFGLSQTTWTRTMDDVDRMDYWNNDICLMTHCPVTPAVLSYNSGHRRWGM